MAAKEKKRASSTFIRGHGPSSAALTVRSPQFYLPDGGVIFLVRFISHTLVELYLVGVINNDSSLVSSTTSSIECINIR
jgi:hypothetical protein